MTDKQSRQMYLLGSAVNITAILSVPTVTSATVTIKDPSLTVKVVGAMTKETDKVYNYIYQSAANDVEGDYIATFTVVYNGYTDVYQSKFTLVAQE